MGIGGYYGLKLCGNVDICLFNTSLFSLFGNFILLFNFRSCLRTNYNVCHKYKYIYI